MGKSVFSFLIVLFISNLSLFSQRIIGGNVQGENGPIQNALVYEKGFSDDSVLTDVHGDFLIPLNSKNPVLVISFSGYETKELEISGNGILSIRLERTLEPVEEEPFLPAASNTETEEVDYATVEVLFATDRNRTKSAEPSKMFGVKRALTSYGRCEVSIPRDHRMGELEEASVWSFEMNNNPEKHVTLLKVDVQTEEDFLSNLRERVGASKEKKAFLFVHGYNVSFEDAARRTAQMAYDLGFDGAPVFYSWPSQERIFGYNVDEGNIEWSKENMKNFIRDYVADSGAENIYLIAHSMGNRGLSGALVSLLKEKPDIAKHITEIILAAPDVDADIFKQQIAPVLLQGGKPVTLYTSSKDIPLLASQIFSDHSRAGQAGESMVLLPGIETIDASSVKCDFLGHSYFGESTHILSDIFQIVNKGKRPDERLSLQPMKMKGNTYWEFKN